MLLLLLDTYILYHVESTKKHHRIDITISIFLLEENKSHSGKFVKTTELVSGCVLFRTQVFLTPKAEFFSSHDIVSWFTQCFYWAQQSESLQGDMFKHSLIFNLLIFKLVELLEYCLFKNFVNKESEAHKYYTNEQCH